MVTEARDPGIDVELPDDTCEDEHCPFHGELPVRGTVLTGNVVSLDMDDGVVVEKEHVTHVPKYERYMRRRSKYSAHRPPCIDVEEGDEVKIAECRPLSKTISFVLVENVEGS